MTHDEIINMPAGKNIDELIIEKIFSSTQPFFPFDDFRPSNEIESAWQVVKKMPVGYELRLHEYKFGKDCWRAEFHKPGSENYMVLAETAPLAICRAALLAVMNNK